MPSDIKVNLEGVLLSYYIKYDRLLQLSEYTFKDINPNTKTIDIFIDLYDMLKPVYTRDVYATKKYLIASSIINIAAHYRGYYRIRHHLHTRIFLVYGAETADNHSRYVSGFGDTAYRQSLNFAQNDMFINSQLELVKILAAYIPDVYFVKKNVDFTTVAGAFIDKFNKEAASNNMPYECIVITKSKLAYTIPAELYLGNTPFNIRIFRPKKYNGEDTSYVVDTYSSIFTMYKNIKSQNTLASFSNMHPMLLGVLLSLTGLQSCNVPLATNVTTAAGMLSKAIEDKRIVNGYSWLPDSIYDGLTKYGIENYIKKEDFCI